MYVAIEARRMGLEGTLLAMIVGTGVAWGHVI